MKVSTIALAVAGVGGSDAQGFKVGQQVQTTSGVMVGHASAWKVDVSEYLGVPFAKPPVGPLRWMPPAELKAPTKVVNATTYSMSCAESASRASKNDPNTPNNIGASEGAQSEDCLYLNIWTKPQVGERKKAVLAWIYGGAFIVGSANNQGYKGAHLAEEQDVVVVGINYRIGPLGFPGIAPDGKNKNPGLLDQRAALVWLRDNIGAFGGDPARITVFGQSAGGASTDFLAFAYPQDPIAHAFIPQSGTVSMSSALGGDASAPAKPWVELAGRVGCKADAADVGASVKCMQAVPTDKLLDAAVPAPGLSAVGSWGPKPDGVSVFADSMARRDKGEFAKLPILVGNTNNEGITFANGSAATAKALSLTFSCAAAGAAAARRKAGVPAWRYEYRGEFPNMPLGGKFGAVKGAWHGSELGLLFGTTELKNKGKDTEQEAVLSRRMRDAWGAFAKEPKKGLERLGWPVYDEEKPTVVVLGGDNDASIKFESPKDLDKGCALVSMMAKSGDGLAALLGKGKATAAPKAASTATVVAPAVMGGHSHGM